MKTYIAGPLFNDDQVAVIKKLETTLTERGYKWFSPRSLGTFEREESIYQDFDKVTIVERNKEELRESDKMVAILTRNPAGNFDIGTLWEMGYFASRLVNGATKAWEPATLMNRYIYPICSTEDKDKVTEVYGYLLALIDMVRTSHTKIGMSPDPSTVNLITYGNLSEKERLAIESSPELNFNIIDLTKKNSFTWTVNTTVLIDDRPELLFILLGLLTGVIEDNTGLDWTIGTASLKGYGSNIMISHSTDYHIQIEVSGDRAKITDKSECTELN